MSSGEGDRLDPRPVENQAAAVDGNSICGGRAADAEKPELVALCFTREVLPHERWDRKRDSVLILDPEKVRKARERLAVPHQGNPSDAIASRR